MATPFATLGDLRLHWSALPVAKEDDAEQKLIEASIEIRAQYPDIDANIAAGRVDADAVKLVACRMVKRSMDVVEGQENVAQQGVGTGPFSFQTTFRNTDGALYIGKNDRRLLAPPRRRGPFTTFLS